MSKFQRTFQMTIQGRGGKLHNFAYPLTVIFDTQKRAANGNANCAHFMIYNLSESSRSAIEYDLALTDDPRRTFQFRAGYISDGYLPVLFEGSLKKVFSYRDSKTDVITDIEVTDGLTAMEQAQIQRSRTYPWAPKAEVEELVKTMNPHGVTLGAVGSLFDDLKSTRGVTWLGSTWDELKKFARARGGYAFIDKEKVYLLGRNDFLLRDGLLPTLDASTGLLETPRKSGITLDAQMLFEPRIELMQLLRVLSSVNPSINNTYQVFAIYHRGMISGAKDGGVVTALSLQRTPESLVAVSAR